ncbi:MAG: GHMP kinase [Clostridiales bacterium]|nr:GHMP kinase [Clostridiales bacterium]
MKHDEIFKKIYGIAPDGELFCPYRICTLGAHVDHQGGRVNGFAINFGVTVSYRAAGCDSFEAVSKNFPDKVLFSLDSLKNGRVGDWADYIRGAAFALNEKYTLKTGILAYIDGDVSTGGLSSSAAVTVAFLSALAAANNISLSENEMILTAQAAENRFVGVMCGTLDQSCVVLSRRDSLLYLDTECGEYRLIPSSLCAPPHKFAVFSSGVGRTLASSGYNSRRQECADAAVMLAELAGIKKDGALRLCDIPRDDFERFGERLPETLRNRAEHYFTETARAALGAEAWQRGDIEKYGNLMRESGESSIYKYESGSRELIALHEIINSADGVYGARFSGAGFGGCAVALINPDFADDISDYVSSRYLYEFPELSGNYAFYLCESADGILAQSKG